LRATPLRDVGHDHFGSVVNQDGERAPLRKRFRNWIFRYVCNAVANSKWRGMVVQERLPRRSRD
jgi:hypothetical protein